MLALLKAYAVYFAVPLEQRHLIMEAVVLEMMVQWE